MPYKGQIYNNCYAYGCDIATNSFPQPGRANGIYLYPSLPEFTANNLQVAAAKDGLIPISNEALTNEQLAEKKKSLPPGHFVAFLFSQPDQTHQWPGDYHWCRQDQDGSWSQKDGSNSVTNFDFAGKKITNPAKANWVVTQFPSKQDHACFAVGYDFQSYMYVPDSKVNII